MDTQNAMLKRLSEKIPFYARDLFITLKSSISSSGLTEQQFWGCVLAVAIASRNIEFTAFIRKYASEHLNNDELEAVNSATALMGMNNIYWRFWYLADDRDYLKFPSYLSEDAMHIPDDVNHIDFECWELAVSVINGCSGCIKVHSHALYKDGFKKEKVLSIVRIASVIYALAVTMENEGDL
jgi:alkyl hydroperoxide reductase subunit D